MYDKKKPHQRPHDMHDPASREANHVERLRKPATTPEPKPAPKIKNRDERMLHEHNYNLTPQIRALEPHQTKREHNKLNPSSVRTKK